MQYLKESFTVKMPSKVSQEKWERIFGKDSEKSEPDRLSFKKIQDINIQWAIDKVKKKFEN